MITLEALRSAVLAAQPAAQLDRIIRDELAAGQRVKAILAEYAALLDSARATPGLTEDADDALLDVHDALTGNCHRDWCYFDPPALPTEEEVAELPRWARVAFAARCARRVHLKFEESWPILTSDQLNAVAGAVRLAELFATLAQTRLRSAEDAAADSLTVSSHSDLTNEARAAGQAASMAALTACYFEATTVVAVAEHALDSGGAAMVRWIRYDFDSLAALAGAQHWDDDTPVPPEFFGPLWPEGTPPGWPSDPDTPRQTELEMEIVAGERAIDRIVGDEVVNLFNAINRYHVARGERPLSLEELWPYFNPSLVPVEA